MTLPTREETMEAWGNLLQRIPPKWVDDITVLDALVSARHCGLLQTREEWAATNPEHQHQWLPWLSLPNGSSWTQCTGCGEQFQYDHA